MKSALPKVLHPVAGRAMVHHVLDAAKAAGASRRIVVLARGMDDVAKAVAPAEVAIQDPPLGTGHAVLAARHLLNGFQGRVAVLFADTPLITTENFSAVERAMDLEEGVLRQVLGFVVCCAVITHCPPWRAASRWRAAAARSGFAPIPRS
mgnify:CR=1 FL=1